MRGRVSIWARLLVVAALGGLGVQATAADEGQFYGLMRERDLTPFGFMRLDMRPAHAVSTEPGSWALETDMAFQNTWALSPEVEKYLTGLEPTGRRKLGAEELQAIRDLPGENYLVDLEAAVYDVTVHYKLARDWSAYLVASGVSFRGGFMDNAIEQFHDTFGFSTFGRPALARNQVNTIFDLKGTSYVDLDAGTTVDCWIPCWACATPRRSGCAAGIFRSKARPRCRSPASAISCPPAASTSVCRRPRSTAARARRSTSMSRPSGTAAGRFLRRRKSRWCRR